MYSDTDYKPYISAVTRIDPEFKAKWVAELRSGKRQQGKGVLRSEDNKFCCLGVACDMLDLSSELVLMSDLGVTKPEDAEAKTYSYGDFTNWQFRSKGSIWYLPTSADVKFRDGTPFTGRETLFESTVPSRGDGRLLWALPTLNDDGLSFEQIADIIDYFL